MPAQVSSLIVYCVTSNKRINNIALFPLSAKLHAGAIISLLGVFFNIPKRATLRTVAVAVKLAGA